MRELACGCRLDKLGRATPCETARRILEGHDATTQIANPILHSELQQLAVDHLLENGLSMREIAEWSTRAEHGRRRTR